MKAREQLRDWLVERGLDQRLTQENEFSVAGSMLRYDLERPLVRPGEIYILNAASNWGPVYVLVLEIIAESMLLVIPFGRYATPAVPGEWGTGHSAKPLRVLCFWNAREIGVNELVGASAKKLSDRKFEDSQSVYRHVVSGTGADERLIRRLGPPLIHPADPRYDYLDEERQRLDDHVKPNVSGVILFEESSSSWLMAAEGRPKYGELSDE